MMKSYNFFTKPSNIMLHPLSCLLSALNFGMGDDATGPSFLDGNYLKKAQYFSGRTHELSKEEEKTADKCGMYQADTAGLNSELLYGPPRYHFEQHPGALASGPFR
ncbi:hypothetical protein F2Q69_00055183 [Brassica cretica]|uniref:Uncharacterized protein n=1 Tax=Brassica cretica TaxID=69181 RepID=A0A8S9N191_BRACR|nr:hypothetical protein F2Q69_00055183 [Brassica cretica]